MRSLKQILMPTDFSPRSVDVARYAAGIAHHFHSQITLLNVLPPINPAWVATAPFALTPDLIEHQKEQLRDGLRELSCNEFKDVSVSQVVLEGDPADVIARYATTTHVGLVMMPTRGCGAFRRFLLGSVTAKVLHDVNCPVWTSSHVIEGPGRAAAIPKIIVCAIDLTAGGDQILRWASDLASDLSASLVVVHVSSFEFQPETYYLEAEMRRKLVDAAKARIEKVIDSSRTPTATVHVEGGAVSTVVRSVIEDRKADLLIIGRSSSHGVLGRLRTHSYALIRESPCPVISI